ncbi:hypothetical protein MVEG_05039 [Podila verticillata NRRL 6337]|nr:hypothetical protein MVEG_05039 [Podila verticillata NRRL 6337]
MSSRRQSRGHDAPMLRPNYVFPPVKEGVASPPSSASPSTNTTSTTTTESSNATLAPPVVLEPKSHLKTHYRTHSRNGSTVTVQDLKQAIAAVASSQLDPPPAEVEAATSELSSLSLAPPSTSDATILPKNTTTEGSPSPSVDAVSDPVVPAYQPYRPPGSRLRAESETKTETKPAEENEKAPPTPDLESDSSLRTRKPVPPPLVLSTGNSEKAKASEATTFEGSSHSDVIKPVPQIPSRILTSHATPRLISSRSENEGMFSPRTAGPGTGREGTPDYFSMRPMQPPRTPMTPGGDFGDDDDDYYGRLHMVTTPMIQNGFFPNWAKGDAQLEELERIRKFLSARQYPDEMPLSDEWTLFFSDTSRAKDKSQVQDAYSSAITPLFTCHTVPQFATSWKYVRERVRPASMNVNQNLHWFKKGIKPMWEDPRNKYGGRLTICPPRAQLDLVWETVLILMAGDVLDHHGESTGAVFARRARGDRVEVWLGSDDTPESLAHIRGVLCQELAASGADELIRTAKYKKHFDARRAEKVKEQQQTSGKVGSEGSHTPSEANIDNTITATTTTTTKETLSFEAFAQKQKELQAQREKDRELAREREREGMAKEQERIMQLGKERLEREKEKAERDRLRDERVRAMAAAAMAASEAKHQQQLLQRQQQQ